MLAANPPAVRQDRRLRHLCIAQLFYSKQRKFDFIVRLIPSDPDIETIVRRIDRGHLNLQPDFQRGEVWNLKKQKLLIDSILRNWHVPPIHVVETLLGEEVLDGQQRLVAIKNFSEGRFSIEGGAQPNDEKIALLGGLRFENLPTIVKEKFLGFSIRFFTIVDFSPEEPAELFYRLNQPLTLTSPEQRNAFFGKVRDQIKSLVNKFSGEVLDQSFLGFSNSRMAWDDVISRVCYVLEKGTLRDKITANKLANRYRKSAPFSREIISSVETALWTMSKAKASVISSIRFNKATLFSWLYFFAKAKGLGKLGETSISDFINIVEAGRQQLRQEKIGIDAGRVSPDLQKRLFSVMHDRSSSRVGDVSSVLVRDFTIWALLYSFSSRIGIDEIWDQNADRSKKISHVIGILEQWSPDPLLNEDENLTRSFFELFDASLLEADWEAAS